MNHYVRDGKHFIEYEGRVIELGNEESAKAVMQMIDDIQLLQNQIVEIHRSNREKMQREVGADAWFDFGKKI